MQEFRVLMFGSRRAGKSSILASMVDSFSQLQKTTTNHITLTATEDTKDLLERKHESLEDIFKNKAGSRWTVDFGLTDVPYEYEFRMAIAGSESQYTICFKDIPGEWLKKEEEQVKDDLSNSQIIMIAIDTPHMLEEEGAYNDAFNITENIDRLLRSIQPKKDIKRLFLFVPIKCEKYYHERRMDEVIAAIKEQYKDLLKHFGTGIRKDLYTVAITPVLTLGGVVFQDFQRNAHGDVEVFDGLDRNNPSLYLRPKAAYYQFYEQDPTFRPQYCEQPVLYLLNFVMSNVSFIKKTAKKKTRWRRAADVATAIVATMLWGFNPLLFDLWKNVMQDTTFIESAEKTYEYLKTVGDGYCILQDPIGLAIKPEEGVKA